MAVEFHTVGVRVRPETDDAVAVTLEVPDDLRDRFRHVPGQHVVLRREIDGEDVRRSYSICTSPDSGRLQVGIKRIPDGAFSTWATTELRDGDTIDVLPPIGEFVHEPDPSTEGSYVALAAGSGITPVLSIVTSILEGEPQSRVTLVYGNRRASTIMFLEEIEALKNAHTDRFQVIHVLSREPHEVPLFEGRIDAAKIRALCGTLIDPVAVDAYFVCGPLDMVETAGETLTALGVEPGRIRTELFFDERIESLPAVAAADGALTLTFTIDGRSSTVDIALAGPSLLDYARSARSEVPFACKGGMCATCKGLVVDGEVTMEKNYALTDAELGEGYVLTCQAHPVAGDVVLTYDVHGGVGR